MALGPWADVLTRALGYDFPLAVKRGYHMHYRAAGEARLNHPVLDTERGYFLFKVVGGLKSAPRVRYTFQLAHGLENMPTPHVAGLKHCPATPPCRTTSSGTS